MSFPPHAVGLALSGGGSRAAAFHRGTLLALIELGLVDRVDVVSTVSGGSLFGGAWLASRAAGTSDSTFLTHMRAELAKGFVLRSARPVGLIRSFLPGIDYSRTHLIADTFDRIFFHGRTLSGLPARPALCLNTALLNNGQVGKFSREGFSAWGLVVPGSNPQHLVPWGDFPLSLAVAASAAFPVGLPPLELPRRRFPASVRFTGALESADRISLTDGGVLENLGIQTLLVSNRFAAWNLVVSDAGTHDKAWSHTPFLSAAKGLGIWVFSGRILDRLMLVMNDKQNRWAREQVIDQLNSSWLVDAARGGGHGPALTAYLGTLPARPRRRVLFVRVDQDWRRLLASIPHHRLVEIAVAAGLPPHQAPQSKDPRVRETFLDAAGLDLQKARDYYAALGGDQEATALNDVKTNFTALSTIVLDRLAHHAAWQAHAAFAIYGL